jgi:hypothetical protein
MHQISERNIVTRIRRSLAKEGQLLFKCRTGSPGHGELGDYYITYFNMALAQTHVNLEDCAKSLGLVRLGEQLAVSNGDGTHGL